MRIYYKGKRLQGKVLKHSFLEKDGESKYWVKVTDRELYGCVIGGLYELPDKGFPVWHEVRREGEDHPCAEEWQAAHKASIALKLAGNKPVAPQIGKHVDALCVAARNMSNNERAAFLAYLIRQFMSWR